MLRSSVSDSACLVDRDSGFKGGQGRPAKGCRIEMCPLTASPGLDSRGRSVAHRKRIVANKTGDAQWKATAR